MIVTIAFLTLNKSITSLKPSLVTEAQTHANPLKEKKRKITLFALFREQDPHEQGHLWSPKLARQV